MVVASCSPAASIRSRQTSPLSSMPSITRERWCATATSARLARSGSSRRIRSKSALIVGLRRFACHAASVSRRNRRRNRTHTDGDGTEDGTGTEPDTHNPPRPGSTAGQTGQTGHTRSPRPDRTRPDRTHTFPHGRTWIPTRRPRPPADRRPARWPAGSPIWMFNLARMGTRSRDRRTRWPWSRALSELAQWRRSADRALPAARALFLEIRVRRN